jgi:hypothetical protein
MIMPITPYHPIQLSMIMESVNYFFINTKKRSCMQKYILLALTISSASTYAMETHAPHIVENIHTTNKNDSLARKLSQKFTSLSKCPKKKKSLYHQSPQVSCVHSQTYLDNLDKHPSIMLAAINNKAPISFYPNIYSKSRLEPMLNNISVTLAATQCVIATNNISDCKPNYAISLDEGCSFAGHAQGSNGDVYATIPIAAAYALKTDSIKHILVIDENVTLKTVEDYFNHGNGSIFYPKNNPKLSALFGAKVITHNQSSETLWNLLHKPNNDIDLVFYNINIDDFNCDIIDERKLKIMSLLYNFVPTVFILSGDKDKYQDAACSIIDHTTTTAQKIISFLNAPEPERAALPIRDFEPTSSRSRSSSASNDEQKWQQFKKNHDIHTPSSSSGQLCHAYEDSSSSCNDYNDTFVLKVTNNIEDTQTYDGANYIYLADKITIDDNGIMNIELNDNYDAYGAYQYHSPSSSAGSAHDNFSPSRDNNTIASQSEDHVEELIFKLNKIRDTQ